MWKKLHQFMKAGRIDRVIKRNIKPKKKRTKK